MTVKLAALKVQTSTGRLEIVTGASSSWLCVPTDNGQNQLYNISNELASLLKQELGIRTNANIQRQDKANK